MGKRFHCGNGSENPCNFGACLKIDTKIIRAVPSTKVDGAGSRIRTDDRLITNQVLYQLSYTGDSWERVPCRGVFGKQDGVNRETMNQSQERLYAI